LNLQLFISCTFLRLRLGFDFIGFESGRLTLSRSALIIATFIIGLSLPCIASADSVFSVSALGLNIGRDVSQQERKSDDELKNKPAESDARLSEPRKASKNTSVPIESKTQSSSTPNNKVNQNSQKKFGALGFDVLKRRKESSRKTDGVTHVEKVVPMDADVSVALPSSQETVEDKTLPILPLKRLEEVADEEMENKTEIDSEQSDVLQNGGSRGDEIAIVTSPKADSVSDDLYGNSFQSSAKNVFAINRRKEPQFISKTIGVSAGSETSAVKFAYSWYWGHIFAAVNFRTVQATDTIYVAGLSDNLMQSEITKSQEHIRVYPFSWVSRFSRLQVSYGMFYSRRNYLQKELGAESIRFDNEVAITADQYGLQSSFLYRGKNMRFRGFVHVPATLVAVDESYHYDENGLLSTFESSEKGAANVAYEVSLDVLIKSDWGLSVMFSGAYEMLPLEYRRVSVTRNIDDQIEFGLVDYNAENRSIDLSTSIFFDALNIVNISPYVALNFNRDMRFDKIKSTSLTTDNMELQIGISGQF